jgi:PAS domain S-box-containing protein
VKDAADMHSRNQWLLTTINAVREVMVQRLEKHSLDPETERELQMALEEIEVMWEELLGQADLLTREHKRYQEFFEHCPDAYAVTDLGGNVREANCALAELLGTVRADLLGKPLFAWVPEEERVLFLENLVCAPAAGGKACSWRSKLRPAQGDCRQVLVSVRAMPLYRSAVSGMCWLFRAE